MNSTLADFIERSTDAIIANAIEFARTVEVDVPLDAVALRDHLPQIIQAIVLDLRTAQTRNEEIEKSEGRAPRRPGEPRSAAGTHALHRAHSGYSIAGLVSEYRAMRASVLRMWADADEATAKPSDITRFNEAIDEAIAESVTYYSAEVERWRNIFLGVLGHDLRSPLAMTDHERLQACLREAVTAIYLGDSSDYLSALWSVVLAADPDIAALLEQDEQGAFERVTGNTNEEMGDGGG